MCDYTLLYQWFQQPLIQQCIGVVTYLVLLSFRFWHCCPYPEETFILWYSITLNWETGLFEWHQRTENSFPWQVDRWFWSIKLENWIQEAIMVLECCIFSRNIHFSLLLVLFHKALVSCFNKFNMGTIPGRIQTSKLK